ncbi:MAG: sigma-70 family RNA polymerase sigma factor [Clostridia bacterium]|nr:sigma-70 family RNA polymerase sigma factor [Clostridia bacterium]
MDLGEEIVREYLRPLYYFALKKTSDRYEAEDLSQEILCELLDALDRGNRPADVRAWVWKIARNRYARWADRKHRRLGEESVDAIAETVSDNTAAEDRVFREEERTLLYRELSLLATDYSRIVAAYYFDNRSVSQIAQDTGLPPGTIKRKLYESRQQIKEGMNMSRTYGKRAFAPENVIFHQNWNPDSGEGGHRLVERLIPQNILLEAYDNPCTVEELSLALGVAVPYIEDEIRPLIEYGLLLRDGKRYMTGIVILSKKTQEKLAKVGDEAAARLVPLVQNALVEIEEKKRPIAQPFADQKPMLAERLCRRIAHTGDSHFRTLTIRHHDGAEWAMIGVEKSVFNAKWLENWWIEGIGQVIMLGNRIDDSALKIDPADIPVFESYGALDEYISTSQNDSIATIIQKCRSAENEILREDIPAYLYKEALVSSNIDLRRLVMDRLIASGDIVLPEDMNKSAMGVYRIEKPE